MEASALPKRSTLAVIALRSIMNVPDLFKFRIFGFLKISLILRGRLQWDALPGVFELEGCFLCFPFIRDSCNQASAVPTVFRVNDSTFSRAFSASSTQVL
jgi:hypothetical protein